MADGTLKVGTITNSAGSGNIAIGSGVTVNVNRPAFEAYLSSNQSVSDASTTKVQIDTEIFDTDGCYDNATNYRFTPTEPGKYFVYARLKVYGGANSDISFTSAHIYKNGSDTSKAENNFAANYPRNISTPVFAVVDLNGTTDYVEFFGQVDGVSGGSEVFQSNGGVPVTIFGAYKLGA
jgi:hypothetical protein